MKTIFNIKALLSVILMACATFFLASCGEDEDPIKNLTTEATTTEVTVGNTVTIKITSGNGAYTVTSSTAAVAIAAVSGETITITGVAKGSATITLTDSKEKTVTISVTVNSAVISTTTARFKWNTTTVELDKTNNWSTTLLTDRVAVSNVTDKKQYVLVWTGGFTTGAKTNASLRIVEENKTTEVITLTNLEIQASTSSLYSVVFNTAAQSGELVLTR